MYSADGTIRIYELVSGRLLRIFNERSAPRQALRLLNNGDADLEEQAKWAVSQIIASRNGFAAVIGSKVLSWRISQDQKDKKKGGRTGGRLATRGERYRGKRLFVSRMQNSELIGFIADLEMKQDLRESEHALALELHDRVSRATQRLQTRDVAGIPADLGDMTEEEATQFALMLSREEEDSRQLQRTLDTSLNEDLDHLQLDEEIDGSEIHHSRSSSSGSDTSSRYIYRRTPSNRSEDGGELGGSATGWRPLLSPTLRPTTSRHDYNKIQVTPRLVPQSYQPQRSPSPLPDMGDTSWPLPSPRGASPLSSSPSQINAYYGSPPPMQLSSSLNKWSDIAKKGAASSPSLLSPRLVPHQHSSPKHEEMDDELRFVLELSRAEEESRQAALTANKGKGKQQ